MHLIAELTVSNFRSIREASFPLGAFTPLVGINNAGKSNVLRALNWLIEGGKLPATEFGDQGAPVQISARVDGIDDGVLDALGETHRGVMGGLIAGNTMDLRRLWQTPTATAALEVSPDGQSWQSNPRGIDPAIRALFPDPIRVDAMEDAAEQMGKTTSGTTIGQLMKEITAAIVDSYAASPGSTRFWRVNWRACSAAFRRRSTSAPRTSPSWSRARPSNCAIPASARRHGARPGTWAMARNARFWSR
jgi:putative ATP-dependent endonuclease of the OLD family